MKATAEVGPVQFMWIHGCGTQTSLADAARETWINEGISINDRMLPHAITAKFSF